MPALDIYDEGIRLGLFTGIDVYINSLVIEPEFGAVEPEVICCVHKPQETWDGKHELVEELDLELLEARGGDLMNKCFQVSAYTAKPEMVSVTGVMVGISVSRLSTSISRLGMAVKKTTASVSS